MTLKEYENLRKDIDRPIIHIIQSKNLSKKKREAIVRAVRASSLSKFVTEKREA